MYISHVRGVQMF